MRGRREEGERENTSLLAKFHAFEVSHMQVDTDLIHMDTIKLISLRLQLLDVPPSQLSAFRATSIPTLTHFTSVLVIPTMHIILYCL